MSKDTRPTAKEVEKKKYFIFKILNLFKRYIMINNKKNLKNIIDFVNLIKLECSYPSK